MEEAGDEKLRRGGCFVFCLIWWPFSLVWDSEKRERTAAVSQTDGSLSRRRNGDDEEDVPKSRLRASADADGSGASFKAALAFPLTWGLCDGTVTCLMRRVGHSNVPCVLGPVAPLAS